MIPLCKNKKAIRNLYLTKP